MKFLILASAFILNSLALAQDVRLGDVARIPALRIYEIDRASRDFLQEDCSRELRKTAQRIDELRNKYSIAEEDISLRSYVRDFYDGWDFGGAPHGTECSIAVRINDPRYTLKYTTHTGRNQSVCGPIYRSGADREGMILASNVMRKGRKCRVTFLELVRK